MDDLTGHEFLHRCDAERVAMNHRNVPVLEVDDALGMGSEWMRIAGNEGLAVALANDQR